MAIREKIFAIFCSNIFNSSSGREQVTEAILANGKNDLQAFMGDNAYDLAYPINEDAVQVRLFVKNAGNIGLYCYVKIDDSHERFSDRSWVEYLPSFLLSTSRSIVCNIRSDDFLKRFLELYPQILIFSEQVQTVQTLQTFHHNPQGNQANAADPTLFHLDKGLRNFLRNVIIYPYFDYIKALLSNNLPLQALYVKFYKENGSNITKVIEQIATENPAIFINFMIFFVKNNNFFLQNGLPYSDKDETLINNDNVSKYFDEFGDRFRKWLNSITMSFEKEQQ